ncbi:MAG: tungsten formylmethanofuran dehydrogenase [Bacteroidetes bacterium]|nr:tungsten formylmethanofuran dehydrogenase [Bacteroidota bacterium]
MSLTHISSAPHKTLLKSAWQHMSAVQEMARLYDAHRDVCKYVHSTSRGHEAVQLACAYLLRPHDFVYPYYRDESILLGMGMTPYELMLQLLAKRDDPFSGGRTYYAHPSLRRPDMPQIPHQSSSTGMQAIPATGAAQGIKYREQQELGDWPQDSPPLVVCSIGDGAMTEGEVSEALQMAVLHSLPILFLVQDNNWGISASGEEMRAMDAVEFAQGFKGLEALRMDGADFFESYTTLAKVCEVIRKERRPVLVQANCPLLGHHTSGVRSEWYREEAEWSEAKGNDPYLRLRAQLLSQGFTARQLDQLAQETFASVQADFERARAAAEPEDLFAHIYAPTPVTEERGQRSPADAPTVVMVDAALHALQEIMQDHPEALLYGQDVGHRLGGVFREAATLAGKFGKDRVFNTPIQEAYIIGSTAGMSAAGCKPVVEVQFMDYVWPGLNQLFAELSRSYYLSNGKWNVQALIRVPLGAYGSGGPFHSSSLESVIANIRGVKIAYPSTAADMKGLFKAAFYDPNPVVLLEHKGLYWSKVPGTGAAKTPEPDRDYIIPLGKGRIVQEAGEEAVRKGTSCLVVTYGMGVHWTLNAGKHFPGRVEILDLRSLEPLDWDLIASRVPVHNKVLVVTEEPAPNSFAEALTGRIATQFFRVLDAPVMLVGSENTPAIPLNSGLEQQFLPSADKVAARLEELLGW